MPASRTVRAHGGPSLSRNISSTGANLAEGPTAGPGSSHDDPDPQVEQFSISSFTFDRRSAAVPARSGGKSAGPSQRNRVTPMTTIANSEAAQIWDGPMGDHWAQEWDHYDRSLAAYHHHLLAAADLQPGAQALDIGCGNGRLTRDVAMAIGTGTATGLDLSTAMVEKATELARHQGVTNARFVHADIQSHEFLPKTFDLALSRFGAMFFADPVAAFANVGNGCKPGARLTMVAWQPAAANDWLVQIRGALSSAGDLPPLPPTGSPGPFGLADPDRTVALLTESGYTSVKLEALVEPIWSGNDPEDALRHHLSSPNLVGFFAGLNGERQDQVLRALRQAFADHWTAQGVVFESAAWLIRATWDR